MGKGDKKTKRGKIFMGSYGVTRKKGSRSSQSNQNKTKSSKK